VKKAILAALRPDPNDFCWVFMMVTAFLTLPVSQLWPILGAGFLGSLLAGAWRAIAKKKSRA